MKPMVLKLHSGFFHLFISSLIPTEVLLTQLNVQLIKNERYAYYLHYNGKFPNNNPEKGTEITNHPFLNKLSVKMSTL